MTSLMVDTGVSFSSKGAAGAEVPKLLDIPPEAAAITSDLTIRPLGPEPLTELRDTPFSSAILRARGEANMRSPEDT